jgi:hypothetical protein
VTFESGSKLSQLEKYVFKDCRSLPSISIPSSVESIDAWCFYGCSALSIVTFGATREQVRIAGEAFAFCHDPVELRFGGDKQPLPSDGQPQQNSSQATAFSPAVDDLLEGKVLSGRVASADFDTLRTELSRKEIDPLQKARIREAINSIGDEYVNIGKPVDFTWEVFGKKLKDKLGAGDYSLKKL